MKVAIVGGGLVGSLSACYFGRRGYEVHLYEYRQDPRGTDLQQGRSINLALSRRGREGLARMGLEEAVVRAGIPLKGRMIHPKAGRNRQLLYDPVYHQCIYSIGRKNLNEILLTEAEKYKNVQLHFNYKIIRIRLDEGKLTVKKMGSGDVFEDEADLVVGADGAFSAVRREMMKRPMFSFSQTYIEHGYLELAIPPHSNHLMEANHLHIWPRGEFMMIALPNQDLSWTVTLFMPHGIFRQLGTDPGRVEAFFEDNFPDALRIIGKTHLLKQFTVKPSYLVSVKCSQYHVDSKAVIIGDAAHAMVPFYGQGMNSGFEDCWLLDEIIHEKGLSLSEALNNYSLTRRPNAEAICDLAMYNYIEMRDLVNRNSYILRKTLDNCLYRLAPSLWVPLYQSVTFTTTPYSNCIKNKAWQDSVLKKIFVSNSVCIVALVYIFRKSLNESMKKFLTNAQFLALNLF